MNISEFENLDKINNLIVKALEDNSRNNLSEETLNKLLEKFPQTFNSALSDKEKIEAKKTDEANYLKFSKKNEIDYNEIHDYQKVMQNKELMCKTRDNCKIDIVIKTQKYRNIDIVSPLFRVVFNEEISDKLKETLKSLGYEYKELSDHEYQEQYRKLDYLMGDICVDENLKGWFGVEDISAYLDVALDVAKDKIADYLIQMGGYVYTKYNYERIYLSKIWKRLLKADISYHRTGNIQSAYIEDEQWSNRQFGFLLDELSKAYYDLKTKKFEGFVEYDFVKDMIIKNIEKNIK